MNQHKKGDIRMNIKSTRKENIHIKYRHRTIKFGGVRVTELMNNQVQAQRIEIHLKYFMEYINCSPSI